MTVYMRKLIIGKTQSRGNFQVKLVKQKSVKIKHMMDKERIQCEIYIHFKNHVLFRVNYSKLYGFTEWFYSFERMHLRYKREIKMKKPF